MATTSSKLPGTLPSDYQRWKWQVLLSFSGFYLFLYLSRFNFWPLEPIIKQDLHLTHLEIGLINALLLWGFGIGDLIHGRLAEAYGLRIWVLLGACLSVIFNWITSFGTSSWTLAIPWGINGFVNAACWSPAISMISQWWPRSQRGMALGLVGTSAGGSMLIMWWLTGWIGIEFGWRAGFRYPPLIIIPLALIFYFLSRDRPTDLGFPEYSEPDQVSAIPEKLPEEKLKGFGPYIELLTNSGFVLASHVKGLENVVRYGLTTWVPLYYFEAGGYSIKSTVLLTTLLPVGYLLAPLISGIVSDKLLHSARKPLIIASCIVSSICLIFLALLPPDNPYTGATLLFIGGLSMGISPLKTLAVDIAGRRMAGTASGLLDAHGYAYAGLQAMVFSIILDMTQARWPLVFLTMAGTRLISILMIARVKA